MDGRVFKFFGFLVALWTVSAQTSETTYAELGGSFALDPRFSGAIGNILWKHNGDMAAEWTNDRFEYYGKFKDTSSLSSTSGIFVVDSTTEDHTGPYTVQINHQLQPQTYVVRLIRAVPEPKVDLQTLTCSSSSPTCTVICYGNTTGAEPVTYEWWEGDGECKQGERTKTIENNEETRRVERIFCRMKNPLGAKQSDPYANPFFEKPGDGVSAGAVVGIIVIVIAVIVSILVYLVYKKKIPNPLPRPFGGNPAPVHEDRPLRSQRDPEDGPSNPK